MMGFLKAGRPTATAKTPKEAAIEAVQEVEEQPKPRPKVQRFNVDIPVELHRQMKARAAQEGVKLNELAIKIFTEYLSK